MVVSKSQTYEKIIPFLELGHNIFGENRVQEALLKWPALKTKFPNTQLHFIGKLQTNKTKQAVALFDCIQTIDRPSIAKAIFEEFKNQNKILPLMVQINVGEESQKSGVMPCDVDDFINFCKNELKLPIIGVMAIPPAMKNPEPYFKYLKNIAKKHCLEEISMGMSDDFKTALACGSTIVRIGRKVFEA